MKWILIVFAMLFAACSATPTDTARSTFTVEHRGAMREMFSANNIDGNISLAEFKDKKHLYAVAPLENLSGEITVIDGVPYVSFIRDGQVISQEKPDARAIFMVWASVAEWREISIPENVKTYAELEKFIAETAQAKGIDTNKAFPFLIKGTPADIRWHVNDYKPDGSPMTREKHDAAKFKGTTGNEPVEIVGFYSENHAGVFVHHTNKTHLHFRSLLSQISGHVDDLMLAGLMRLYLPKQSV